MSGKNLIYPFLLIYTFLCTLSVFYFNGTGDSGDSVTHYLYAHYAPHHPALYFDHWAKPLFVLMASPFAQFGFTGIKFFNLFVSLGTIFLTGKTADALGFKNPVMVVFILMLSPLCYILTFSGLTEPLFALFTIAGIYFCAKRKFITASVIISFLPYVRSEGLIIIGVFMLYFIFKKAWKSVPLLLTGSIAYAFAGWFVRGSFLWVFTEIPYAKLSSVYGKGTLFHFVEELINVTGIPNYVLFWLGFILLAIAFFRRKFNAENHFLLLGTFCAFFVAHSLFWYLGIFNSMGLKRVLVGIMPVIALIALFGFNFLTEELLSKKQNYKKAAGLLIIAYILVFPFTVNPSAIQWEKDMMLSSDQKLALKTAEQVKMQYAPSLRLIYNYRYFSVLFDNDYFNPSQCAQISNQSIQEMKSGDLMIWDNLYADFESGFDKRDLDARSDELLNIGVFTSHERGKEVVFCVYKKK